jgi:NAD(P)-dependent dehydrogenase (short-subunit alcohol dehydrogenase family)
VKLARRVAGKVAVVTGGGSGMGRTGAALLAQEGARVVIADINEAAGSRVAESIVKAGCDAISIPTDVRRVESVRHLVEKTCSSHGRIDVLYHNAVEVRFVSEQDRRLTELPEETWDRMIELVLTGTYRCCEYVGRQMIAQGGSDRRYCPNASPARPDRNPVLRPADGHSGPECRRDDVCGSH